MGVFSPTKTFTHPFMELFMAAWSVQGEEKLEDLGVPDYKSLNLLKRNSNEDFYRSSSS